MFVRVRMFDLDTLGNVLYSLHTPALLSWSGDLLLKFICYTLMSVAKSERCVRRDV